VYAKNNTVQHLLMFKHHSTNALGFKLGGTGGQNFEWGAVAPLAPL